MNEAPARPCPHAGRRFAPWRTTPLPPLQHRMTATPDALPARTLTWEFQSQKRFQRADAS